MQAASALHGNTSPFLFLSATYVQHLTEFIRCLSMSYVAGYLLMYICHGWKSPKISNCRVEEGGTLSSHGKVVSNKTLVGPH